MLKYYAIGIVLLIVGLLGFAASKPDTFRIARSAEIKAAPDKLFPLVNDFHSWKSWSPYEGRDPALKRSYSGNDSGKGAVYEWSGNDQVGAGRMEIVDSNPPNKIDIKLDFLKPFEGHNHAEFSFEPKGDATTVTWAMTGPSQFMSKLMSVFFNMDKMLGKDFEVGLQNMKQLAEH
jgi:hypothetical protein